MENNADINARNNDNKIPCDLAKEKGKNTEKKNLYSFESFILIHSALFRP